MTRWRLSGRRIGGSGRERSSKAIVRRMPAWSSSAAAALSPMRREERLADGRVGVGERGQGFGGVDHPAPFGGQTFQPEPLAVPDEYGRRGTVDFEDEPWTRHNYLIFPSNSTISSFLARMSKATFTDPRRPAAAACSIASAARSSG